MGTKPIALVAAVSRENGIESANLFERSVNSQKFIQFLEDLVQGYQPEQLVVFMDNLTVHHSKLVQQFMKDRNIGVLFNVLYSPEYNPIELVFNLIKQSFKKYRLEAISQGKIKGFQSLIRKAIQNVDQEQVQYICQRVC